MLHRRQQRGRVVTLLLVELRDLHQGIRTATIHRSDDGPGHSDREQHPSAVRQALGGSHLADRADRPRCGLAADLGPVGDHAHHETPGPG